MTDRQAGVEEVPPGYKRTEVGMIPEDWSVSLLDSIAVRGSGHTPDKKHPEYWDGSIPWISLADSPKLDNGYIYETTSTITPAGIQNSSAVIHPPETVVLTRDAGVGKSAIMGQAMAVSQHFMAWRCGPNINNHFLYYWLQSKKGEFERIAIGNTIKTIGLPYFKNLKIPLPHIHEQYTIAAALSDVDGLIGALDALIEKKRAIKQAAMQQLLTGKMRLPGFTGKWETKRLGDTITFLPTANNPRADLNDDGGIQYIHYGDVHAQTKPVLDCTVCVLPYIDRGKIGNATYLEDGDLIMVDASEDLEGTGKSVEVQGISGKNVIAGLHTILCRGNPEQWARGFKAYLQFIPAFKLALTRIATGISVYAISKNHIAELELALPPVPEQGAIVSILSDMDAGIAALERRREKAEQIKQGMMQQLLTGRIPLVEPPEPAA